AGNDTFTLNPGAAATIDGGNGTNTLHGPDQSNTWNLTGNAAGTLNGNSFSNVANLTGGTGNDAFVMQNGASGFGTISGGVGTNTLDYSAYTGPITINLSTATAPGLTKLTSITNLVG